MSKIPRRNLFALVTIPFLRLFHSDTVTTVISVDEAAWKKDIVQIQIDTNGPMNEAFLRDFAKELDRRVREHSETLRRSKNLARHLYSDC